MVLHKSLELPIISLYFCKENGRLVWKFRLHFWIKAFCEDNSSHFSNDEVQILRKLLHNLLLLLSSTCRVSSVILRTCCTPCHGPVEWLCVSSRLWSLPLGGASSAFSLPTPATNLRGCIQGRNFQGG